MSGEKNDFHDGGWCSQKCVSSPLLFGLRSLAFSLDMHLPQVYTLHYKTLITKRSNEHAYLVLDVNLQQSTVYKAVTVVNMYIWSFPQGDIPLSSLL